MIKIKMNLKVLFFISILILLMSNIVIAETDTDFLDLCKEGTSQEISEAIEEGVDVNQTDDQGRTPLMMAAGYNSNPSVIFLLNEAGANINRKDNRGWTALMYATSYNANLEVMKALVVNNYIYINATNHYGDTALFLAIEEKREKAAEILIKSGARVNIKNGNGLSPLMLAIKNRLKYDLIHMLLRAGTNLEIKDDDGWTAVMYAVDKNKYDTLKLLVKAGAKINISDSNGNNPLFLAIKNKNESMIKFLIDKGVNINKINSEAKTPLIYAVEKKLKVSIIKYLLNAGADINKTDNQGKNVLNYAVADNKIEVIKTLIEADVNVNNQDENGVTPLMEAAKNREEVIIIDEMIEAGAKVNIQDLRGKTALMYAAQYNDNQEIIYSLLESGADPEIKDDKGKKVVNYLENNKDLLGTTIYWKLNYLAPGTGKKEPLNFKSTTEAGLWSALIPSGGHYYAQSWWPKGTLFLLGEAGLYLMGKDKPEDQKNIYFSLLGVLKIWEIIDAVEETEKYNDFAEDFNEEVKAFNQYLEQRKEIEN